MKIWICTDDESWGQDGAIFSSLSDAREAALAMADLGDPERMLEALVEVDPEDREQLDAALSIARRLTARPEIIEQLGRWVADAEDLKRRDA